MVYGLRVPKLNPKRPHGGPQVGDWGGVLAIAGTMDASQKPVLMASHLVENNVRLWELPSFAERGELSAVRDARALGAGSAAGLLVSGDKFGVVKVLAPGRARFGVQSGIQCDSGLGFKTLNPTFSWIMAEGECIQLQHPGSRQRCQEGKVFLLPTASNHARVGLERFMCRRTVCFWEVPCD